MPIKNLTLGLTLLAASTAAASTKTHKDHASHSKKPHSSKGVYIVQNGDSDFTIAHKFHLYTPQLKALNPGVKWENLKIGLRLTVPGSSHSSSSVHVAKSSKGKKASKPQTYVVSEDDNDWTIARKAGVTVSVIKQLNPGVNWNRLRPGKKINIPGSSSHSEVASSGSSKKSRIRSHYAVVTSDDVTIRRGPGRDEDSITTVDSGTRVVILDHEDGWYKLRFPKGTVGWMRGDFLKASKNVRVAREEEPAAPRRRRTERVASTARRGTRHSQTYAMAGLGDGSGLLEKAKTYAGVRYRWGQASRSGTDCSGFTTQVFRSQGVKLPRTSGEQSSIGQGVDRSHLKPGDLVFFHTGRGRRINHVGIYMGNGKFIHASSGGGKVQVNSLNDGFYANHYSKARRVVSKKAKTQVASKPKPKVEVKEELASKPTESKTSSVESGE